MCSFTLGADPELLCRLNGKYVPAHNYYKSNSSFGRVETIKELSTPSPSFSDKLRAKNFIKNEVPQYFEILFKVHGIERSGFNTEILHFHEITSKILVENKR